MATNSNSGFHRGPVPAAAFSQHAISFQSSAVNGSAAMFLPTGSSRGMNSMAGMMPAGNSVGTSGSRILLDAGPGLKHEAGLAADWSAEEQSLLEEGLVKYADEPSILRYIKIAATIPDKTVRDVALRCRWMTMDSGKRRKSGAHYVGKKVKDRKEKLVDSSPVSSMPVVPQSNMASYPFMMQHTKPSDYVLYEASIPTISGRGRHLLEENAQLFSQIAANLSTLKIQENINLFIRSRNNITAILHDMREMPGLPPLPVLLNEELASTIIPSSAQARSQMLIFGAPGGSHLKQEPRC